MRVRFVLISEGASEQPLVAHLETLCLRAGATECSGSWIDFRRVPNPPGHRVVDQITWVVNSDLDVDIVFVHRDADQRDGGPRRAQIAQAITDAECRMPHVAVVPIQEIEAWLLLDEAAIRTVAGNPKGKAPLSLPKPKQVESRARPKEILERALAAAAKPSRRALGFPQLRRRLFERLELDGPLTQLSAWARLEADLAAQIAELRAGRDT